jgi:uncharacterized membrane protein
MNFLLAFVLRAALLVVLDLPWLLATQPFTSTMVRQIQGGDDAVLRIIPAVIVYFALSYLLTIPKTGVEAFLLGSSVYAVYDFTNYATLKNYDIRFGVLDTLWGGILMTSAFYASSYLHLV